MKTLPELYQQMSNITAPKCAKECRVSLSCCDKFYCEIAIIYAKDRYGIDLTHDPAAKLPLMGATGCKAAPHHRPLCALHLCSINNLGADKDAKFTREYFNLRQQIDQLELDPSA